ncbi:UNVERIFIED_CONTAM: hypothetical protein RMT77_017926 [Armadillidium vulgare]
MEDLVSCNICAQVFDSLHFIPKMLIKCGHTFCSPCLIKLLQENPHCPNCRAEVKEIESLLPVNYNTLKAVDIYNSKCWPERKMDIASEVAKRKDIILKKKTQMTLNGKILDKCLAKLEELTMSQSERIDTVNARKILDELDEDLKKTDDVVRSFDIKKSISILLSSFEGSEQFLLEIYKRLQNGEKVFAVHKINEEFKYGEVSFFSNQLFFYSLTSSQAPKDSSLVWFEDVKQCLNSKGFSTFIKISYNEKNVTPFVIIETFDQCFCNKFIKLCTGECGPSYKGSLLKKGNNKSINSYDDLINVFSVEKRIENRSETMRLMDYKRCFQRQESVSFHESEMVLYFDYWHGDFDILRTSRTFDVTSIRPFGRVISPLTRTWHNDINYENPSNLILECGILINL